MAKKSLNYPEFFRLEQAGGDLQQCPRGKFNGAGIKLIAISNWQGFDTTRYTYGMRKIILANHELPTRHTYGMCRANRTFYHLYHPLHRNTPQNNST